VGGVRAGVVVLVRFPFSDLSSSKLRPALVVAPAGGTDWMLCQITSNPYSDPAAVALTTGSFVEGGRGEQEPVLGAEAKLDEVRYRRSMVKRAVP